jgi:outer membrane protein assembly factor BamB
MSYLLEGGTNGREVGQTMPTMAIKVRPTPARLRADRWPFSPHQGVSCLGLVAAILCAGLSAGAANWPQYRGPGARGVDESQALPTNWHVETGTNVLWQAPLPGLAHASPIVWGDRVYIASAVKPGKADLKVGLYGDITPVEEKEAHQWRLLALDKATGKIIWNTLAHEGVPRAKRHPKASQCNSTPATDGGRIVALFGSEGLFCFDTAGKLVWQKDLGPMDSGFYLVPSAQWGFASSPVIAEGKVIVLCDVLTNSFLAAFELADGKEVWRTARKDVPTWSTPTVVETPGRKQIAVNGWHYSGGYDLATGQNLWHLEGGGDIPVPTPVFAHGLIYLTSAHGRYAPMRAVRPEAAGDIMPDDPGQTNSAIVWAHAKRGNYMQTPIVVGDLLFGCTDAGAVTCFDAATGTVKYSQRLSAGGQGFTASPVSDGRHVYFTSEQGVVFVLPVADQYSVAGTNELHETCLATPAISDGTLFFRTREKLIAVGAPRSGPH